MHVRTDPMPKFNAKLHRLFPAYTPVSSDRRPTQTHPDSTSDGASKIPRDTGFCYPHSPGAFSTPGSAYSTATLKVIKRGVFEQKTPKWNGTLDTFPAAEAQLRSYVLGSRMQYITTIKFLACYKQRKILKRIHEEFRDSDGLSLFELGITYQQLKHDSQAMYGAIISIGQGKYATAVTAKHEHDSDGIGAFIDLISKYRLPYSVRSAKATKIINENFSYDYHGGLPQFLLNLEEAYAKLDKVAQEKATETEQQLERIPDSFRLEQLRNKLLPFKDFHNLLSNAQTRNYDFMESLVYFRNETMAVTHVTSDMAKHKSGRRAHHLGMEDEATEASVHHNATSCLLYTSPSPRDGLLSRMPSSA